MLLYKNTPKVLKFMPSSSQFGQMSLTAFNVCGHCVRKHCHVFPGIWSHFSFSVMPFSQFPCYIKGAKEGTNFAIDPNLELTILTFCQTWPSFALKNRQYWTSCCCTVDIKVTPFSKKICRLQFSFLRNLLRLQGI